MNRRAELGIVDCTRCKATTPKLQRQHLACGYEPPLEDASPVPWGPPRGDVGYSGDTPTVCAGYTTKLPEVREASLARVHWNTGNIGAVFGGDPPGEDILNAIVILESAHNQVERWRMTPVSEGGGGR